MSESFSEEEFASFIKKLKLLDIYDAFTRIVSENRPSAYEEILQRFKDHNEVRDTFMKLTTNSTNALFNAVQRDFLRNLSLVPVTLVSPTDPTGGKDKKSHSSYKEQSFVVCEDEKEPSATKKRKKSSATPVLPLKKRALQSHKPAKDNVSRKRQAPQQNAKPKMASAITLQVTSTQKAQQPHKGSRDKSSRKRQKLEQISPPQEPEQSKGDDWEKFVLANEDTLSITQIQHVDKEGKYPAVQKFVTKLQAYHTLYTNFLAIDQVFETGRRTLKDYGKDVYALLCSHGVDDLAREFQTLFGDEIED